MANMFKTIEEEGGGGGGPEWLSSHPDPGNRYNAIVKEAESLQVQGKGDTGQLGSMQARLKEKGPAYTAEQIAKGQAKTGNAPPATAARAVKVDPPSSEFRVHSPASFLQVSIPANWNKVSSVTYAPEGAFFQGENGQTAFTHGVQFGTAKGSGNLQRDTSSLLSSFARTNPNLRQQTRPQQDTLGGRRALSTMLTNVSDVTGQPEHVALTTTTLPDGTLFFVIGVAPQSETQAYNEAFRRVRQSVRIATR
jgi:beta-barrel assembly-enhancing protease